LGGHETETDSVRTVATIVLCATLAAPLFADLAPPENKQTPAPINTAELPPMPSQERDSAVSHGMLLATMAVVLVVLAAAGGLAVYLTRRHQAAPDMKDM
jgi:hypothetical protein